MKTNDPQVQNEQIFSLGKSTKTGEKLRRKKKKKDEACDGWGTEWGWWRWWHVVWRQRRRGGDRWTDRDGDRGTAIRVWDICMATREDRKSRWWMGGPTRGYRGRKGRWQRLDGSTRWRRKRGRRRGQGCDHSERVRVDQEGVRVEGELPFRQTEREKGRGGGGAGEERKVYSLGQAVITGADCSLWRSDLAWPAVLRTQGAAGWKEGERGDGDGEGGKSGMEEGRQTVRERRRLDFEPLWPAWHRTPRRWREVQRGVHGRGSAVGLSELICLLRGRERGRKMEWREDFDINADRDIRYDIIWHVFFHSITFERQKVGPWRLVFCVWEVHPEFNTRTCVSLRKNRYATTNMHEKQVFVFIKCMEHHG